MLCCLRCETLPTSATSQPGDANDSVPAAFLQGLQLNCRLQSSSKMLQPRNLATCYHFTSPQLSISSYSYIASMHIRNQISQLIFFLGTFITPPLHLSLKSQPTARVSDWCLSQNQTGFSPLLRGFHQGRGTNQSRTGAFSQAQGIITIVGQPKLTHPGTPEQDVVNNEEV
jgi:hypothetical protein